MEETQVHLFIPADFSEAVAAALQNYDMTYE